MVSLWFISLVQLFMILCKVSLLSSFVVVFYFHSVGFDQFVGKRSRWNVSGSLPKFCNEIRKNLQTSRFVFDVLYIIIYVAIGNYPKHNYMELYDASLFYFCYYPNVLVAWIQLGYSRFLFSCLTKVENIQRLIQSLFQMDLVDIIMDIINEFLVLFLGD